MEHLTGINIRTGIDLHVPINDIFKTKTESFGDERIKELYNKGNHETFKKYPDLHELFESETDDRIFFNDKKSIAPLRNPDMELLDAEANNI